jgi:hypothetical protein
MPNLSQVAYCGLFCGGCIIRREKIAARSHDLLRVIGAVEFQKVCAGLPAIAPDPFKALSKIDDCREVLDAMSQLDCKRACRQGGGSARCEIRKCCKQKKLRGCWECEAFEGCTILDWLKPVHGDAHRKNLRIIRDEGMRAFLAGKKNW